MSFFKDVWSHGGNKELVCFLMAVVFESFEEPGHVFFCDVLSKQNLACDFEDSGVL